MFRRHRIEDEVEAIEVLLHRGFVLGIYHFIRTEAQGVFHFVQRRGEDDDVRAHCLREFHTHVAEPAESHDADLLARSDAVMTKR